MGASGVRGSLDVSAVTGNHKKILTCYILKLFITPF